MTGPPQIDAGELAEQLEHDPGVTLNLDGYAAFALAAALQLALRHPGMDGPPADMARQTVEQIAAGMGGLVAEILEAGWDPEFDVKL